MRHEQAPVGTLADLFLGILERGIVVALRLDGPPGDRKLIVGLGTVDSTEALMLALGCTSLFRRPEYSYDEREWEEAYR